MHHRPSVTRHDGAGTGSPRPRRRARRAEWFDQALYDKQYEQRSATFEGDPEQPWLQYIDGEMTDTSEYTSNGAKKACFANASISNPWRQTGWITMNQQLKVLQDEGVISEMETRDAEDDDNTQIADIDYFITEGNCDVFIISPNSTAAMTPAVERACETGKPVIVFDRGVRDRLRRPRSSTRSAASRGASTPPSSSSTTSRRATRSSRCASCPGVDVLEQRWAAAEKLFDENGIEAVDYFTGADPTEIKKIITDELAKGDVQGIWMDAGDGAVAAIEAFEDAGADYPVMTGEDEMSFLRKWEETGLTGLAPVYSNFQWRTPLLAVEKIFAGEEVPRSGCCRRSPITEDERRPLPRGQRRHARRPLRQVRWRGPAGLPARSGRSARSPDRRGGPAGFPRGTAGPAGRRPGTGAPGTGAAGIGGTNPMEGGSLTFMAGINTWVWASPLTDSNLPGLLRKSPPWALTPSNSRSKTTATSRPARCWIPRGKRADTLRGRGHGTGPGPRGRGSGSVERTQDYLAACITLASSIGSPLSADPSTPQTGRVWRMSREQREAAYAELRRNLLPVAARAQEAGVIARHRAAEPLRDIAGQHRRPGARGARAAARQRPRTCAGQLPPEHRGALGRRGSPGRRRTPGARAGLRQRPRRPRRRPDRLAGLPAGPE